MARFRGTVQGSRGGASRLGHHGITTDANGWDVGVKVEGGKLGDADSFDIYATGGSNESHYRHRVATVKTGPDGQRSVTIYGPLGPEVEYTI